MGLSIAALIGHFRRWPQARAAERLAAGRFAASALLLAGGLALLGWAAGTARVDLAIAALSGPERPSPTLTGTAALFLTAAAVGQAALIPFHGWLLSSMTAPTPASALMHAGFVNAGGILVARLAPLWVEHRGLMAVLLVLGAVSAVTAKLMKSVQPEIKRQLACSTVGQMGFMMMQAGLGFFSAAITHLLLHGCYKAYLFLAAGERVHTVPAHAAPRERERLWLTLPAALALGVAGAALFLVLTGKAFALNAGLVLAVFVALTVLHAMRDVLERRGLPGAVRGVLAPVIFFLLIVLYAGVFHLVSTLMAGLPVAQAPLSLGPLEVGIVGLFLAAYAAVEMGALHRIDRLYTVLLNLAQPFPETGTGRKEDPHG